MDVFGALLIIGSFVGSCSLRIRFIGFEFANHTADAEASAVFLLHGDYFGKKISPTPLRGA
jgi:hypothetical protein